MNKKAILVLLMPVFLVGLVFVNWDDLRTKYLLAYKHIPDTAEAKEVMQTIERAYDIEAKAAHTFDLSKFSTVFINDPRFPLPSSTLQVVREMTDNLSLESAGYLDYKMAYYSWRRDGALQLEKLKEKAKAENRSLTQTEVQSLTDKYGRTAPPRTQGTTRNTPVKFISMEINDDISYVVIDDGPRTIRLTLVLVDKKWYISGTKGISIHP